MLKHVLPRPRASLGRSPSSCSWHASFLLITLLLLASVVFLQSKLAGFVAAGSRRSLLDQQSENGRLPSPAGLILTPGSGSSWKESTSLGGKPVESSKLGQFIDTSTDEDLKLQKGETSDPSTGVELEKIFLTRGEDGSSSIDDEEERADDVDADLELENEEMEVLENMEDNVGDGQDYTDENEGEIMGELEDKASRRKSREGDERQKGRAWELSEGTHKKAELMKTRNEFSVVVNRDVEQISERFKHKNVEEEGSKRIKSLERKGHVQSIPRWVLFQNSRAVSDSPGNVHGSGVDGSILKTGKAAYQQKPSIVWDRFLGIARKAGRSVKEPNSFLANKVSSSLEETISGGGDGAALFLGKEEKEIFTTDDELLNENIQERLEEVTAIEDALLLKTDTDVARNGVLAAWINNLAKKSSKGESWKGKSGKVPYDPLNPVNNPLLQDPDTYGPTGLTRSDKAILKALRKGGIVENTSSIQEQASKLVNSSQTNFKDEAQSESNAVGAEPPSSTILTETSSSGDNLKSLLKDSEQRERQEDQTEHTHARRLSTGKNEGMAHEALLSETAASGYHPTLKNEGNFVEKSQNMAILETIEHEASVTLDVGRNINTDRIGNLSTMGSNFIDEMTDLPRDSISLPLSAGQSSLKWGRGHDRGRKKGKKVSPSKRRLSRQRSHVPGDSRRWGYFPGLDPLLSFSEFLEQFLDDSNCSVRVFMAWTTPPWSYTVRYQRSLESVLHFHPRGCVVIFSESMELDFFKSFVEDGYRVAVVMPNLEELLKDTPAEIFASVWLMWRKIDLYYIHYTELLRLVALYKYGGVYLDTDLIILKPIKSLHNSVGTERVEDGELNLNGAFMMFDKYSPFLLECLAEYTATYDDQLLDWNGARLLTRVANRTATIDGGKKWRERFGDLNIEPPSSFFPLSRKNITSFFAAPNSEHDKHSQEQVFQMILDQSYALHFWNRFTWTLVPEVGSLVEKFLNQYCLRCNEYL